MGVFILLKLSNVRLYQKKYEKSLLFYLLNKLKSHQLERAQKLVDEINKKNRQAKKKKDIEQIKITKNQNDPKRFIKWVPVTDTGELASIEYLIDKDIYENEEKYNGLYGITTNLINNSSISFWLIS